MSMKQSSYFFIVTIIEGIVFNEFIHKAMFDNIDDMLAKFTHWQSIKLVILHNSQDKNHKNQIFIHWFRSFIR